MALASNLVQIGLNSKEADFLGDTQSATITATGTTQVAAFAITSTINAVSTATIGVNDAVRLPVITTVKSFPYIVHNATAKDISIFPGSGDNFYSAATNAATVLASGGTYIFWPISSLTWVVK